MPQTASNGLPKRCQRGNSTGWKASVSDFVHIQVDSFLADHWIRSESCAPKALVCSSIRQDGSPLADSLTKAPLGRRDPWQTRTSSSQCSKDCCYDGCPLRHQTVQAVGGGTDRSREAPHAQMGRNFGRHGLLYIGTLVPLKPSRGTFSHIIFASAEGLCCTSRRLEFEPRNSTSFFPGHLQCQQWDDYSHGDRVQPQWRDGDVAEMYAAVSRGDITISQLRL